MAVRGEKGVKGFIQRKIDITSVCVYDVVLFRAGAEFILRVGESTLKVTGSLACPYSSGQCGLVHPTDGGLWHLGMAGSPCLALPGCVCVLAVLQNLMPGLLRDSASHMTC